MLRLICTLALFGIFAVSAAVAETRDFSYPDLDGKIQRLSDYRGKWVLVNYWATWCPPCLEEIPELEVFHSNHQDKDAVVLGVNMEEIDRGSLEAFVDDQFISYPILRTGANSPGELGRVTGLPTSYLISPSGKLAARRVGPITASAIESFIQDYPATSGGEQP